MAGAQALFDDAVNIKTGEVDKRTVRKARSVLESVMLRRVKADVESSLHPKLEFVLKVS